MTTYTNTFKVGDVLDQKLVILDFIDRGGMGEVYRAHQTNLNRDVAVKVISHEWLESNGDGDEEAETLAQRFQREVQSMAQIRHPNVLQVFDHHSIVVDKNGAEEQVEYIAMEYIPGGTLRETMSEEGFYPEEEPLKNWIRQFFLPVLSGVQSLHQSGIIHRDLKPENILMDHEIPKIADFGLARSFMSKPVTQSIVVKGSPHYMSPEHFLDFKRADQRSDIYSLGKILYEVIDGKILTKTIPFHSAHLSQTESSFFKRLDQIIAQATEENIDERIKSITDLKNQLVELLDNESQEKLSQATKKGQHTNSFSNPKIIWVGITIATLSVALMTLWHIFGNSNQPSSLDQQAINQITINDKKLPPHPGVTDENKEHMGEQHLIPKGMLVLPSTLEGVSGQKIEIPPFYMDEFFVTNGQFVEFLNHNLSRIKIESGVVKGDGANWYLLGEVHEGYEPIKYESEEFHIVDFGYDSRPVLRVTGFGAAAFANYFGRRLPNETEWLYATIKGVTVPNTESYSKKMEDLEKNRLQDNVAIKTDNKSRRIDISTPEGPPEITFFQQNEFGIRALNTGIGEWGLRTLSSLSKDKLQDNLYVVLGSLAEGEPKDNNPPSVISRFPWEGFEEVGFRTVLTASPEK
jgi:eukaryotic-like serine/threonine-protein kinase